MSKSGIRCIPSFTLFGIRASDVHRSYASGEFINWPLPIVTCDLPSKKKVMIGSSTRDAGERESFSINVRSGSEVVYLMTNVRMCEGEVTSGPVDDRPLPCDWCGAVTERGNRGGIPVNLTEERRADGTTVTVFHCEGCVCDFRCGKALLDYESGGYERFSHQYQNKSYYLNLMFSLAHPGQILTAAPFYRLHQRRGGPLSDAQFKDHTYKFIRCPGYRTVPVKSVYQAGNV